MQAFVQSSDNPPLEKQKGSSSSAFSPSAQYAGSTHTSNSSRSPYKKHLSPAQAEAYLLEILNNPGRYAIRDSWISYDALPLDRRRALDPSIYAQLVKLQKALQLPRRGSLWQRLSSIYAIWQEQEPIPAEELRDTLSMVRAWFEQKEIPHAIKAFAQARRLCCEIGGMLSPYADPELWEQVVDLVLDYGSTDNLVHLAHSLSTGLASVKRGHRHHGDWLEAMPAVYSKVISGLAQRRELEAAYTLASSAWNNQVSIHEGNCGRDILVALLAMSAESPGSILPCLEVMRFSAESNGLDSPVGKWYAEHERIMQRTGTAAVVHEEADIASLIGGNEAEVALSLAKNQMRHLLVRPSLQPSHADTSSQKDKQAKLAVRKLSNALEAMQIYDEFLSKGFQADRELYRIAKSAKKRIDTHSTFSPMLREAAHLRAMDQRAKEAKNFKKKWYPASGITGRWSSENEAEKPIRGVLQTGQIAQEPVAQAEENVTGLLDHPYGSEDTSSSRLKAQRLDDNIYTGATPGQIMHLAIETGDFELARAILPTVMQDPAFSWTAQDDDRALSLLSLLIQDATRSDINSHRKQAATQLACAFYASWQEDLSRDPQAHVAHRANVPRMKRAPAFDLLRLLAHHRRPEGFAQAMQALVQDPSLRLAEEHMRLFARHVLRSSKLVPWLALKLYITKENLARRASTARLVDLLDRAIAQTEVSTLHLEDRAYIRWCDTVMHFMRRLDITVKTRTLRDVLDIYEGRRDPHHDSLAAYVVEELRKANIKPATERDDLLIEARLRSSASAAITPLLDLLEADSVSLAAAKLEGVIDKLLKNDQRADAQLIYELFKISAERCASTNASEVSDAIEAIEVRLGRQATTHSLLRPADASIVMEPTVSISKSKVEAEAIESAQQIQPEVSQRVEPVQGMLLKKKDRVSMSNAVCLIGFLGDFFSDAQRSDQTPMHAWTEVATSAREAAVGFQDAVDPEKVQLAAASPVDGAAPEEDETPQPQYAVNNSRSNIGSPILAAALPFPNQAYSTLAAQANLSTAHLAAPPPSILHEISQLPQQFADLTMEQIFALKRRCEIEMEAVRRRDEQVFAARRISLSRADASRWQGWQEFQATPWY